MRRMFREVCETRREVSDYGRKSVFENLQESSELLRSHGVFTPNPDTKPGGEMWNRAKAELGYEPDEELDGFDYAIIAKKILDLKKAEKQNVLFGIGQKSDEEIKEIISPAKSEMPESREVENGFTQKAIMAEEIKADTDTTEPATTVKTHWEFDDSHEKPDERSGEYLIIDLREDGDYEMRWGADFHDGEEFFVIGKEHVDHIMATEVINPGEENYFGWSPLRGMRAKIFLLRSLWRMNYGIAEKVITEVFSK